MAPRPFYFITLAVYVLVFQALPRNLAHADSKVLSNGGPLPIVSARGLTPPNSPSGSPPPSPSLFPSPTIAPRPPVPSRGEKYPEVFSPPGSPVGSWPSPREPSTPVPPPRPPPRPARRPQPRPPASSGSPGGFANVPAGAFSRPGSPSRPGSSSRPGSPLRPGSPSRPGSSLKPGSPHHFGAPPVYRSQPSIPPSLVQPPYQYRPAK
uniref:Vegetative cell wall protein gp1 n=1 Tax=Amblyomma triste TaxID=251400 RepID=A0A023GG12_AMBTT